MSRTHKQARLRLRQRRAKGWAAGLYAHSQGAIPGPLIGCSGFSCRFVLGIAKAILGTASPVTGTPGLAPCLPLLSLTQTPSAQDCEADRFDP